MNDACSTTYYTSDIPRLDPDEKALWLEALASDRFAGKQGYEALQTADGTFCCLGVYCETKGVPKKQLAPAAPYYYGDPGATNKGYVPGDYEIPYADGATMRGSRGFSGIEYVFDLVPQGSREYREQFPQPGPPSGFTVASLNDSQQFTFDQIADIIDYFL